jgi:quinol monooxygenase YgiN
MVAPTRLEMGCAAYNLHEQHAANGLEFSFYEIWASEADHAAHVKTAHVQALLTRQHELVEGEIVIEPLAIILP